jgi:acetylornithine deacetylase/succinyl-diaminopimelate desuccinylase-like protein
MLEKTVATCAPWLRQTIARGIETVSGRKPRQLMSGAGHDGQAMIGLTDIGMIFVRCQGGISHSPLESVSEEDMGLGVEALIASILEIARSR